MSDRARTVALVLLVGVVVAAVALLAPSQLEPAPAPPAWDEIPVCIPPDCGVVNAGGTKVPATRE